MSNKTRLTNFKILRDENIESEIKVLLILEMLHNGEITINKAKELCTECGIFSDHWVAIDAKATHVFSKHQESK